MMATGLGGQDRGGGSGFGGRWGEGSRKRGREEGEEEDEEDIGAVDGFGQHRTVRLPYDLTQLQESILSNIALESS